MATDDQSLDDIRAENLNEFRREMGLPVIPIARSQPYRPMLIPKVLQDTLTRAQNVELRLPHHISVGPPIEYQMREEPDYDKRYLFVKFELFDDDINQSPETPV